MYMIWTYIMVNFTLLNKVWVYAASFWNLWDIVFNTSSIGNPVLHQAFPHLHKESPAQQTVESVTCHNKIPAICF